MAGPCVVESENLALDTAGYLRDLCDDMDIRFIYKSSFDKANRSSHDSFRGPGFDAGLKILEGDCPRLLVALQYRGSVAVESRQNARQQQAVRRGRPADGFRQQRNYS